MTMTEEQIQKEKVAHVYGLTGGELNDEPWIVEPMAEPPHTKQDPGETLHLAYWYDGLPDYCESDYPDRHDRQYRTVVWLEGGADPYLRDSDGCWWKLVETCSNSGEAQCPLKDCEDEWPDGILDTDGKCVFCEEKPVRHHIECNAGHKERKDGIVDLPSIELATVKRFETMAEKESAVLHCLRCGELKVSRHSQIEGMDGVEAVYGLVTRSVDDMAHDDECGGLVSALMDRIHKALVVASHTVSASLPSSWSADDVQEWRLTIFDSSPHKVHVLATFRKSMEAEPGALFNFVIDDDGKVTTEVFTGWLCSFYGCNEENHSITEEAETTPFTLHVKAILPKISVEKVVQVVNSLIKPEQEEAPKPVE